MGFFNALVEFVKSYFTDLHLAWTQSDWFGFSVMILVGLFVSIVLAGILWMTFLWLERLGTPVYKGQGRIVDKSYTAPSTTYVTTRVSNTMAITTPVTTGPDYELQIRVPGGRDEYDTVSVDPKFYERCREGSTVEVEYQYGRFTKTLHIRDLWG